MSEKKRDHAVKKALVMVSQVGISMITPMLICGLLGYYIDNRFHTSFWFIILVIFGIIVAFRNVYLMLLKFYKREMDRENEQLRYENELKEYKNSHGPENIDDLKVRRIRKR